MDATAVVLQAPEHLGLARLDLTPPTAEDVVVEIAFSGISTGTEKLLWSGRMPQFPGMGYPLVPGYESVGQIVEAGTHSGRAVGDAVFVPGANCYGPVRGLFGGAASRIVLPGRRVAPIAKLAPESALLALGRHRPPCPGAAGDTAAGPDRRPWCAGPPDRAAGGRRRGCADGVGGVGHPPVRALPGTR